MEVILHLGGDTQRAKTAAQLALSHPKSVVVVSSEGDGFYKWYDAAGISRQRIIVDTAAWDTVTNFTHTYKLLKSLKCSHLYVVTSAFHSPRAKRIASACWGGRVPIDVVPHGTDNSKESEDVITGDFYRALSWRLFGVVFFSKKIRQERQPGYKISDEHGREIGIS
jgi:uncharacterized SAM-binding protein YcdF (DUF218 family)